MYAKAQIHVVKVREYHGEDDHMYDDFEMYVAANDGVHAAELLRADGLQVIGEAGFVGQRLVVPTGEGQFLIFRHDDETANLDVRDHVLTRVDERSAQGFWLWSKNVDRTSRAEDRFWKEMAEHYADDYP